MGGVVAKAGTLGYELLAGEVQVKQQSNLLPLGEVTAGSFQHRSLLFKVRVMAGTVAAHAHPSSLPAGAV